MEDRNSRSIAALAMALGISMLGARASATAETSATAAVSPNTAYEPGEVLVRFDPAASLSARNTVIAGCDAEIAAEDDVLDYHVLRLPAGASVERAIEYLRSRPGVLRAEPNYYYYTTPGTDPHDPDLTDRSVPANQWGIFKCGIPRFWRHGGGGTFGVTIAIIDTGIDNFASPHGDLAQNVLSEGKDFIDGDDIPTDVGASAGHGTHVAGIAAAVSNTVGIAGVAYSAGLYIVRVLDCTAGSGCPGTVDNIASGVRWAADQGARVINMSLAGPPSFALESAIGYAAEKECILVAASGNNHAASVSYPAAYEPVVAVGATDSTDAVASFSNYGAALDVVAPGVAIHSTWPGGYNTINGTSMASPFVAGIAALIWSKNPGMTPLEFQSWIRKQTVDLAGTRDGYGRVDFGRLEDWSDATGYPMASHRNFLWEWLGDDASSELSTGDAADTDGRPNMGGSHDRDAYDDGVFPGSSGDLPWLPMHLGSPPGSMHIKASVGRTPGPRYGPTADKSLHLDSWFDWNSNRVFDLPFDRVVADRVENPGSWGGATTKTINAAVAPPDEHILGNPLVIRTRLAYGGSAMKPDSIGVAHGEVEDDRVINFVEEFDTALHILTPGIYMSMNGGWGLSPDPQPVWPYCAHRYSWEFAATSHPSVGFPCTGFIEGTGTMSTPVMDLKEHTTARLRFWYCHQIDNCGGFSAGDHCRVRVDTSGVKIDLYPLPLGTGDVEIDLTPYVGCSQVKVEFVEDTDEAGGLAIDDVVLWAYDNQQPMPITDLTLSRRPDGKTIDLTWSHPIENGADRPSDPLANTYDIRWAFTSLASEAGWRMALPFVPRDGTIPIPSSSGTVTTSFEVPSAFMPYRIAIRTGDEVTNLSPISNTPLSPPSVALGVQATALNDAVAAPGDTAVIQLYVRNEGSIADAYSMTASGTKPWPVTMRPAVVVLDPGADTFVYVHVEVPTWSYAGEMDTLTMRATSSSDPSVSANAHSVVWSTARTSVTTAGMLPDAASLHVVGANPFRESTSLALALPRDANGRAAIYDVTGRHVRTLAEGVFGAGNEEIRWDGRDEKGTLVGAGVYFFDLRTDQLNRRERLVLMR